MYREEDKLPLRPYQPPDEKTFFERFDIRSWTFYVSMLDLIFFALTIIVVIFLQIDVMTDENDEVQKEIYSFDCVLYYFGAKHAPSIRYNYEFHRLIMPAVLHGSIMHILGNLSIQLYYGFILEKYFGIIRVGIVYILGGIGGCLFSCVMFKYNISVGASAAIFGLLGLEFVYFIACFPKIDKKRLVVFIFVFPTILLSFIDIGPQVDVAGHLGGLVMGLTLGIAYVFEDYGKKFLAISFYIITGLINVFCLIILFTMELDNEQICPTPK